MSAHETEEAPSSAQRTMVSWGVPDPLGGRLAVPLSEAARLLGISSRHARDLVAEGVLSVVELGCKRVVAVSELRRLLGEPGG